MKKLLAQEKKFVLAVSGGPDSICLLDLFAKNFPVKSIIVAHYNHQLRGFASDQDAEFVKKICKRYRVTFITTGSDVKKYARQNKLSLEEAARIKRYEFLAATARKQEARYIVTGHHGDDQVETVLLRLFSGSAPAALKAMLPMSPLFCDKELLIFRPLLNVWRKDIEEYVRLKKISFCTDASNTDTSLARNRIRHDIIPFLKECFPHIKENLLQYSHLQAEDEARTSSFLRKRALLKLAGDDNSLFSQASLQQLDKLLDKNKASFSLDLKKGYKARKNGKKLEITKAVENDFCYEISKPQKIKIKEVSKSITIKKYPRPGRFSPSKKPDLVHLDANKVSWPITIRSRQEGDWFQPYGQKGSKKLQDYFVDKKISRYERWTVPVFKDADKKIFCIGGHQIDDRCKITDSTKNILEITLN